MAKNKISEMLDGVDKYPFHMPGHKRNTALIQQSSFPYDRDITEIAGSDNLHNMSGVILEECNRAARLWGAERAHILVNGSTCGILSAIRAYAGHDCSVIVARNCHKSVYNGIELCRLTPTYVYPETDPESGICASITPEQVKRALLDAPDAKLVILTSPSYEGVISDIAGIAHVVHAHGAQLLVDAAHGAHLGLGDFPDHPITQGADVVICSLHKTLPAPTQTAIALIGKSCADPRALAVQLSVFQTSSPSYILMEEAARCVHLLEQSGEGLMRAWSQRLDAFEQKVKDLGHLRVLFRKQLPDAVWGYDRGKTVISTRGTSMTGYMLAELLRSTYCIEVEMATSDYVIAMTSLADTLEGLERLACALLEIDCGSEATADKPSCNILHARAVFAPHSIKDMPQQGMILSQAVGHIAAEYVWAYPPGIPLVVPGERITPELLDTLEEMQAYGIELESTLGGMPRELCVVIEE